MRSFFLGLPAAPAARARHAGLLAVAAALASGCAPSLEAIKKHAMIHSAEIVELRGEGRNAVLVAPRLQGRILTCRVGAVESVGYVRQDRIEALDLDKQFNNYGGLDRLWLGPEAGRFGLYFEPGSPIDRKVWRVPGDLNAGAMSILEQDDRHLRMARDLELVNYAGTRFKVRVEREVGLVPAQKLNEELGLPLPAGVEYIGCYSLNSLIQLGPAAMERDKGLLCLWVLGMLNASPQALVIAPLRKDEPAGADFGPKFNDDYFGRVSQETPERLKLIDDAVIFRADAQREGKFGLSPQRAIGVAGSFDPARQLLVIVKYDVHPEEPLHASFSWRPDETNAWSGGDVFQSYNADASKAEARQNSFYELESVSPCKELKTGESLIHRHATFCFQGDRAKLNEIARAVLNVDLETAVREMLGS